MILLSRADVQRAIWQGKTLAGEWHICQRDGAIYWKTFWGKQTHGHVCHPSLRLPALFPEGERSRYCYFCLWVKKEMAPDRRYELLSLVVGAPSPLNPDGNAFAVSCVVTQYLTREERERWNRYLMQTTQTLVDNCMVALNDLSRRSRFCYREDS